VLFRSLRTNALANCGQQRAQICKSFAQNITLRAQENKERNCGLNGPYYTEDFNAHYSWCMQANPAESGLINQQTQAAIQQCRTQQTASGGSGTSTQSASKLEGVCGIFVAAAFPLIERQNAACSGQPNFAFDYRSKDEIRQICRANSGGNGDWVNARVAELNAHVEKCESNTRTYTRSELGVGTIDLDVCADKGGLFCGDKQTALMFCKWKGHETYTSAKSGTTGFTTHLFCLQESYPGRPASNECYCNGKCGYYKEITCTGRK